jgi:hypothetical protein
MTTNPGAGDFQLVKMGGRPGEIIRLLQWANGDGFADFEHVRIFLALTKQPGMGLFFEAQPGGAVLHEHSIDVGNGGTFWSTGRIRLTADQRAGICAAAQHYAALKVGYSSADYAALVAARLNIPVPGLEDYIADSGHMICSQAVARCYWDGGHPLFDRWTGDTTPGDLWKLLQALPG